MVRILMLSALIFFGKSDDLFAQNVTTLVANQGATFEAITWAGDGRIFVVDYGSGEVFQLNTEGDLTLIGVFPGVLGGAVDAEGNFYVSQFGLDQVVKIEPDFSHSVFATGIDGPAGILVSEDNQYIFVTAYNDNLIVRLDLNEENPSPEVFADDSLISGPDGLVFDSEGNIISVNYLDGNVQQIDPEGNVSLFTTIEDTNSTGYIVNYNGGYLVTGANTSNKIYFISGEGEVSVFAGTEEAGNDDGPIETAQFNFPNGIAISPNGDSLLVAQSHNSGRIRLITELETAISETDVTLGFSLFPNPVNSNEITIQHALQKGQNQSSNYTIYSMNGQVVQEGSLRLGNEFDEPKIDVSKLSKGLYVVGLSFREEHTFLRFIVE